MENKIVKPKCKSSIALGIVGIVFSGIIPLVTYACSITGLSIGIKKKETKDSRIGIILNIIGICLAVINTVVAIFVTIKMFNKKSKSSPIENFDEE